ncbi:MAG: methionyl-tRNA formyltransferase [Firmicutes bacterium]|nr:methionyl-tRNA formyltransferase [Bacillota bacterium]
MRIIYMGTPEFAVAPLQALAEAGYEIAAVVTQPDRPRSRGRLLPTPVKAAAEALGLPVLTPEKVNREADALAALKPDLLVVVAYGQLLSERLLALAPLGAVNIHGSLLPAYRGAAPINAAVINGETESGVTIMYLDKGMDSGDMILQDKVAIPDNMTAGELYDELCRRGTALLLQALPLIAAGTAPRTPQDHSRATYAPMLKKEDELIDWGQEARRVHDRIRGMNPFPGAYTLREGKRLKLWASRLECLPTEGAAPGTVVAVGRAGLWVACADQALLLTEVQPEGKSRMDGGAYVRGYQVQKGLTLGR